MDKVKVEAQKAQEQEVESGQKAEKAKQIETRETAKRLKVCAQACLHNVCCVLLQYLLLTVGRLSVTLAASLTVFVPCFHRGVLLSLAAVSLSASLTLSALSCHTDSLYDKITSV